MTITVNSKTIYKLCIQDCIKHLDNQKVVNLQAFDDQVGRLCQIVEQLKSQIEGLHQVNELTSNEEDSVQMKVYLTRETPNRNHYGYQLPKNQESEQSKIELQQNIQKLNQDLLKQRNLEQKMRERNQKILERKKEKIFDNEGDQEMQRKEVEEFKVTMKQTYKEILALLYEKLLFQENPLNTIKLVAAGKAIPKACFLTEMVKHRVKGLYQITTMGETENTKIKYMNGKTQVKDVIFPLAEIYLSKIKLNHEHFGYQDPIDPTNIKQITEQFYREKYKQEILKNHQLQQQQNQQQQPQQEQNKGRQGGMQWKTRGGGRQGRGGGAMGNRPPRHVQENQGNMNIQNQNMHNKYGNNQHYNDIQKNQIRVHKYGNLDDGQKNNEVNNNKVQKTYGYQGENRNYRQPQQYQNKYQKYNNQNNYYRGGYKNHQNDYYIERDRRIHRYRRDENRRNYPNNQIRGQRGNQDNRSYYRPKRTYSQDQQRNRQRQPRNYQEDFRQNYNYKRSGKGEYNPNTQVYVRNYGNNEDKKQQRKYFNYHLNDNQNRYNNNNRQQNQHQYQQQNRKYGNIE